VKVAVFGLGYVGCVSAACLAQRGHDVVGVDVSDLKVEMIASGRSPVLEPGLPELVSQQVAAGRLRATTDPSLALAEAEVSMISVGTPSTRGGGQDLQALERVAASIGEHLPKSSPPHTVVVRSTVLPGTTETVVEPRLFAASRRALGRDLGVAVNPEFLREGSAIADFDAPPKTVIGESNRAAGDRVAALYEGIDAPLFRLPVRMAELVKYVDNAFHALKITFANEIGVIARENGVDSHELMSVFAADRKLNISEAYLRPGFAFGGSCLPKDLRALVHKARQLELELPLLESILPANQRHLERTLEVVLGLGRRRVALLGLAFKPGIDDLRESPLVELAERLVGKGYELKIFDRAVSVSRLVGANRDYMLEHLPHLSELLVESPEEALADAEVCVVGAASPEAVEALAALDGRQVVDLVRLPDATRRRGEDLYVGVAW
jgi:GDP-mannose 6-dehydrogenase